MCFYNLSNHQLWIFIWFQFLLELWFSCMYTIYLLKLKTSLSFPIHLSWLTLIFSYSSQLIDTGSKIAVVLSPYMKMNTFSLCIKHCWRKVVIYTYKKKWLCSKMNVIVFWLCSKMTWLSDCYNCTFLWSLPPKWKWSFYGDNNLVRRWPRRLHIKYLYNQIHFEYFWKWTLERSEEESSKIVEALQFGPFIFIDYFGPFLE